MDYFETFLHELTTGTREPYFPKGLQPKKNGLVALGGDLSVEVLLEAYTKGYFPWSGEAPIPWFCPHPRLLLFPDHLHISKSLKKLLRQDKFTIKFDTQFRKVMENCASIPRMHEDETWISSNMIETYEELHSLHVAHSIEVYLEDELCGGLYGLSLGNAFFGESMFAKEANASKVALFYLCEHAKRLGLLFIDCQTVTGHLVRMGGVPVPRQDYTALLEHALEAPSHHYQWNFEQIVPSMTQC